ncbi:hypothetical protein [Azospirillum thermophilum]|uniref:hypothetical protein n=1 Tax=Azospirillum thermophilum TaxID=2202148 RepID=UPI0011B67891|nr:hypothetical protein [Azospirillum thermophilum]
MPVIIDLKTGQPVHTFQVNSAARVMLHVYIAGVRKTMRWARFVSAAAAQVAVGVPADLSRLEASHINHASDSMELSEVTLEPRSRNLAREKYRGKLTTQKVKEIAAVAQNELNISQLTAADFPKNYNPFKPTLSKSVIVAFVKRQAAAHSVSQTTIRKLISFTHSNESFNALMRDAYPDFQDVIMRSLSKSE